MVRALTLLGPRQLEIREEPSATLEPGQARLRSLVSGVSHGTELNLYRGTSPFAGNEFDHGRRLFRPRQDNGFRPHGIGYELVSEVVEVAPDVSVIKPGDVVHTAGSHRDETVIDVDQVLNAPLPLTVLHHASSRAPDRPERAVFLSLAGVALQAVHDAYVKLGDTVVVSGLGVIGLLTVQLVRMNGARSVIAIDPKQERRTLAQRFGATAVVDPRDVEESIGFAVHEANQGKGVDTVIETSGTYSGLHAAIASVGIGGRVVSVGFFRGDAGNDLRLGEEWHHNRPTLVSSMGVWGCPHHEHPLWDRHRVAETAAELLLSDQLVTEPMLTRTVPFDDAPQAYADLDADPRAALKIALSYV
jgi:2-desacetyl-2-hydroxyethyl bacteriochlorophyllide A dehydrogenase